MSHAPCAWFTRVSKNIFTRESTPVLALLAIATVIRLPLMPFQGYWHDLASYISWGNELVSNGFSNLYAVKASAIPFPSDGPAGGAVLTAINYPPGMPYLFGGIILLYHYTLEPVLHAPLSALVGQAGIGPFIAKLVILVADLATINLLYREARKRHSQRFALLAAALFAFSPAVLYDGVVWGQTDALVSLPLLIGVFALFSERYTLGGASFAIAVLLKAQTVIFIPLVLLYLWRWTRHKDFIRFSATLLGVALLIMLPVMIPRFQVFTMLYNMRTMSYNDSFPITQDAYNFWWLIGLHTRKMGSSLLGVRIGLVADALFGMVTLAIGVHIWRHRQPAYLCFGLALEAFGFFMFMGGQLERYLFLFIPLMLATLIVSERKSSDRLLVLYIAGTALSLLNMLVSIGAALDGISQVIPYAPLQPVNDFILIYYGDVCFAIAAYITATFAYAMQIYLSSRFEPLVLVAPAHDQHSAREATLATTFTSQR